jgi:DNA-binding winged helix-turn-helix (wHTH) protein/TolB-like protein
METHGGQSFVYEFGKFVLDPDDRTLFSDGVPLHLPAKEFDTLLFLIQHNGKAVSKEEMMSAIWHDSFVEESNLAKQISRLRKIFQTKGADFIETVPKHGYRFSADIRRVETTGDDSTLLEKRTVKRVTVAFENDDRQLALPRHSQRRWPLIIAACVLVIAVVGTYLYWRKEALARSSEIRTIAVLPLRSLSESEDINALGLGLADSLITELGSLRHLVIRPIGSVRNLAGSTEDPVELGRKLNVDAVFDGTIQQAGGKLRINARLISTQTGEQVWASKFDDDLTSAFEVQDRICEQTARALSAKLTGTEPPARLTKRYTESAAAFDAYLKGRYYWNKRTEPDFRRAITEFNRAVDLDPNYALAYSGLADSYVLLAVWGTEPPRRSMELAKQAAYKALSADANLVEAHTSLAFIRWVYDWDFAGADAEFSRALELNPNYATTHHWRAYYLVSMGRSDEAIAAIKRAQELEGPLSLSIMTDIGEIYCWAEKYDEAIDHLNETIKIEPNYAIAHYELGIAQLKKELYSDAIAHLERARVLENGPRMTSALAFAYGTAGRTGDAAALISELESESASRYVSPFSLALAHAGTGNHETAIDWLEKAREERSDAMGIVNVHPLLLRLHSNPRFANLVREVGFAG